MLPVRELRAVLEFIVNVRDTSFGNIYIEMIIGKLKC